MTNNRLAHNQRKPNANDTGEKGKIRRFLDRCKGHVAAGTLSTILIGSTVVAVSACNKPTMEEIEKEKKKKLVETLRKGDVYEVKKLLNQGLEVDTKLECDQSTLLMEAVSNEDLDMVKLLVERGADINAVNDNLAGWTPLMFAVNEGNLEIVEYLIDKGADINHETEYHVDVFYIAGENKEMMMLLKYKQPAKECLLEVEESNTRGIDKMTVEAMLDKKIEEIDSPEIKGALGDAVELSETMRKAEETLGCIRRKTGKPIKEF